MTGDLAYEREVRIAASRATVFELLTDPDLYPTWMAFGAEFELRPGGKFRLDLGAQFVSGEFLEIRPDERVVFTWGWEGESIPLRPGQSTVEFTLIPDGSHTIVRLRHSGLSPALRAFHGGGWELYLNRLAIVATGGDPGEDPMASRETVDRLLSLLAR